MPCPTSISFGEDVRRPDRLETRNTRDVLLGIRNGEWKNQVAQVRQLPPDSPEQKAAKLALPYALWSGVFSRRCNTGLIQHSGQCGIDLDHLGDSGATAVLQTAVADIYCLAAFRSARGEGVRLIFRVPPCSPENHVAAFEQIAVHVSYTYGHEPDTSGKDVSRASFVSFDNGLWVNFSAATLPIEFPDATQRVEGDTRCVSPVIYAGQLAITWPGWYGRHYASTAPVLDGTAKTHRNLLDLGKAVALHAHKIKTRLTPRIIDTVLDSWLQEHSRQGVALRCRPDDYRRELLASVRGAERKPWFKIAAEKWLRWTRHEKFPRNGTAHNKILFAIHCHCSDTGSKVFFLSVRDAGLVAGVHFNTAARALRRLVKAGKLEKLDKPRHARHAQTYQLK